MYSSHFYTHTVHSSQVMFPLMRVEYLLYVSYMKFCMEFVSSLLFITLFNYLFISVQTHECLFFTSHQNSVLLLSFFLSFFYVYFFLFQFLQMGPLGTFSVSSCALLKQHHHFFFFFFLHCFNFLHCSVLQALILCIYFSNPQSIYKASLIAQLVKNPVCNVGVPCSIPGLGRSLGDGIGYPVNSSPKFLWSSTLYLQ